MQRLPMMMGLGLLLLSLGQPNAHASPIGLSNATATFSQNLFGVGFAIDGSTANGVGWAIDPQEGVNQTAVFETNVNVGLSGGSVFTFTLTQNYGTQHDLGRFRLSVTTDDRSTFADGLATGGDVTATWILLTPNSVTSANGTTFTVLGDSSVRAGGPNPLTDVYTVTAFTPLVGITGVRLEVLSDPLLPFNGPGRHPTNGNFVLSELALDVVSAPAPEPATAGLLLLSGGMFLLARRRLAARSNS